MAGGSGGGGKKPKLAAVATPPPETKLVLVDGKTPAETKAEHQLNLETLRSRQKTRMAIIDNIYRLMRSIVVAATVIGCFYLAYRSVASLAGKDTKINGVVKGALDLDMNQWFAYALSALCGGGWYNERRLRRKTITEQGAHIKKLEDRLVPERQSSGLLPDGRPKKKDRDA